MRRFLLASAAAVGLILAAPALAQAPDPVPSPPPVTTPPAEPDETPDEQLGTMGSQEQEGPAAVEAEPQAEAAGQAAPAAQPSTLPAAAPAAASQVCAPRTTEVNFGRASSLSRDNSNTIERAVDAASVCSLEQVVIAQSGEANTRRAGAVRALLVRQGVPAEKIQVQPAADAAPGEVEVRMTFAGVARGSGAAAQPAAQPAPAPSILPEAAPEMQPETPDADTDDTPQDDAQQPPDT